MPASALGRGAALPRALLVELRPQLIDVESRHGSGIAAALPADLTGPVQPGLRTIPLVSAQVESDSHILLPKRPAKLLAASVNPPTEGRHDPTVSSAET